MYIYMGIFRLVILVVSWKFEIHKILMPNLKKIFQRGLSFKAFVDFRHLDPQIPVGEMGASPVHRHIVFPFQRYDIVAK